MRTITHKINKNKPIFFLIIGILAGCASLVVIWFEMRSSIDNAPSQILVPNVFDFDVGEVDQGNTVGNIVLKNNSKRNIELVHIVKTCRCSEVNASVKEFLPGQSITLDIAWDTRGLRGMARSDFVVFYRPKGDRASERLDLSIFGTIIPEYDIEPNHLVFRVDEPSQQLIKIIPRNSECQFDLVGILSDYPVFRFEKKANNEGLIMFEPKDWFIDPLRPSVRITIETSSPKEPSYVLPVTFGRSKL